MSASDEAPEADLATLHSGAATLGIDLSEQQLAQFARLRTLLLDWNTRLNLTTITAPAEVETRHFLDSLTCVLALPAPLRAGELAVLDVGTGAGFPGLPLAIAFPTWRVTLLEATAKKVRYLDAVLADLGLANARTVAARAEEFAAQAGQRGAYDLVTARALASLPTLLEWCAPFVRVHGRLVAPKKGDLAEEILHGQRAALALGARLLQPVRVTVPPLDDGRLLLVTRQVRPCPPQYPRPGGAPRARPLG